MLALLSGFSSAVGRPEQDLPAALPDKPVTAKSQEDVRNLEKAIQPYVRKAKKTFPKAKKRFLKGLPAQYTFFVTTKIHEGPKFEMVFIAVNKISKDRVYGQIWNDIYLLKKYKYLDEYDFPEEEILDWTIRRPDGSEEGNFVGNFLDKYRAE